MRHQRLHRCSDGLGNRLLQLQYYLVELTSTYRRGFSRFMQLQGIAVHVERKVLGSKQELDIIEK